MRGKDYHNLGTACAYKKGTVYARMVNQKI